ncbi:MAG TPA: 3-oxoacyl-[acyl-carrier-protein] synthase III C-terminal domain-containing protein [Herpetosiphonaceae bacterium]
MPAIVSVATAVPPYAVTQQAVCDYAREFFRSSIPDIERYLTIFDNAQIDTRYLSEPPAWYMQPHGLGQANDRFIDSACQLGEEAARRCMEQADVTADQIDHLIFVSTTGLAAPSIDARLITLLNLSPHTRRTPIWGLGCAGGLGGLARAQEYVRAFPTHRVLLVTVELCTLTLQPDDRSKRNLVALSLFGDGAAAVLVAGDQVVDRAVEHAPRIVDTHSTLFPDSLDLMGWDVVDQGFRVVFGSRIPSVVTRHYRDLAAEFLALHDLTPDAIDHHIYHPGGAKVLQAYQSALDLAPETLDHSRAVLREYGNMSSATIFFVLERFLKHATIARGDTGLLCVFGPGFSSELVLIEG